MAQRIHTLKKVVISDTKIRIAYAEKTADGKYGFSEVEMTVSNPKLVIDKYNADNKRVLEWEVIGEKKTPYKVDKEALYDWIRTHGTPMNDNESEDIEE